MRANVEKHRQSLVEVLRQGEEDAHSLQKHIKVCRFNKCHQVALNAVLSVKGKVPMRSLSLLCLQHVTDLNSEQIICCSELLYKKSLSIVLNSPKKN